jgi:hypothetical protein
MVLHSMDVELGRTCEANRTPKGSDIGYFLLPGGKCLKGTDGATALS